MNKTNLLIDLGIFGAFLIADQPRWTGIPIHEWLSIAFAATIIVHILLHWKWIMGVGGRYFKNLWHVSRLKFVVDLLLFVVVTAVIMSGLMISRSFLSAFGIYINASRNWRTIHDLSANLSLYLMALHVALSWKWVVGMSKRYLLSPVLHLFARREKPAVVSHSNGMMGLN
jgi:hypothetical protein